LAFGVAVVVLYGLVAIGGVWHPKLGLDLQGGTSITLTALTQNGKPPSKADLEQARSIIDQRVNGSGVAESQVFTQGGNNIVVEIPGHKRAGLVDTVKRTAQLRFRLVALQAPGTATPKPSASPSGSPSGSPSSAPSSAASPGAAASSKSKPSGKASASPHGRALSLGLLRADKHHQKSPAASPTASTGPTSTPSPAPSASPSTAPATTAKGAPIDQPLQWMDNPGSTWLKKFAAFSCPAHGGSAKPIVDDPDKPLITCGKGGLKYLLSKAIIEGTQLTGASAGIPQGQLNWVVNLSFNAQARKTFADVTTQIANQTSPLTGQPKLFAIVLDGRVIEAPKVDEPIPNGQAQISGGFTSKSATSLATSLKYGALPLRFKVPVVTAEGPTLASDQLSGGLIAGAIGLALVLLYCMFYYRGLSVVVFASLAAAAAITYAIVVAMSQAISFTLTLPGIAGFIVAIGITADSFIVYFERIRDEMREGKSMRVAVEAGWTRARATCVAADTVSLLAAVVLYIFAIGVVKGFAFALGVSTAIDLVVFFSFTKPMVTWLARFRFYNSGHRMSGLSPEHVGIARIAGARPARTSTARAATPRASAAPTSATARRAR
jgi:preprotein translocase subunit SecD